MPSSNGSFGSPSIASDGIHEMAVTDFSMRMPPLLMAARREPSPGAAFCNSGAAARRSRSGSTRSRGSNLLKQVARLPLDRRRQVDVEVIHEPFAEEAELGGIQAPDRATRDRALVDPEEGVEIDGALLRHAVLRGGDREVEERRL